MNFEFDNDEVLQAIWARSEGELVFMPEMSYYWAEGPGNIPALSHANFSEYDELDFYFSPLRYDGARRHDNVGRPGVIFADMDDNHKRPRILPSVVIETSEGHYHMYWFLDTPADPSEWEKHAKGWSQELSADPGGWDLTQVLRVPGTINRKPGKGNLVRVRVFRPDRVYKLEDFPQATRAAGSVPQADCPVPDKADQEYLLDTGELPLTAQYWLTVAPEDLLPLGKIDRSAIMWGIEKSLLDQGYSPTHVFQLVHFSAINKWRDNPSKLWAEIHKAAAA